MRLLQQEAVIAICSGVTTLPDSAGVGQFLYLPAWLKVLEIPVMS